MSGSLSVIILFSTVVFSSTCVTFCSFSDYQCSSVSSKYMSLILLAICLCYNMNSVKKFMLLNKYHFLFFELADPDFLFLSSRSSLVNENTTANVYLSIYDLNKIGG
jgi:hypothetical protein